MYTLYLEENFNLGLYLKLTLRWERHAILIRIAWAVFEFSNRSYLKKKKVILFPSNISDRMEKKGKQEKR